jgi:hypothetical protein
MTPLSAHSPPSIHLSDRLHLFNTEQDIDMLVAALKAERG